MTRALTPLHDSNKLRHPQILHMLIYYHLEVNKLIML